MFYINSLLCFLRYIHEISCPKRDATSVAAAGVPTDTTKTVLSLDILIVRTDVIYIIKSLVYNNYYALLEKFL